MIGDFYVHNFLEFTNYFSKINGKYGKYMQILLILT
ncbi:hypothetical protein BC751_3189 [Cecembia calidifontis]|uniref:Uncharacterized protein n=1 Tax=Cecembia calidifontis TaxID=1187080 RepID=A0A4Q7PBE4_9BACT|nr:hypothetical protein BC751_3189 [Cecembia calidifontis]